MKWVLFIFILLSQTCAKEIILDSDLKDDRTISFVDNILKEEEIRFNKLSKSGYSIDQIFSKNTLIHSIQIFKTSVFANLGFQTFLRYGLSPNDGPSPYKAIGIGVNYNIKHKLIIMMSFVQGNLSGYEKQGYDIGMVYMIAKGVGISINYDAVMKEPTSGIVFY